MPHTPGYHSQSCLEGRIGACKIRAFRRAQLRLHVHLAAGPYVLSCSFCLCEICAGVDDQFVLAAAQRANSSMRGNAYFGRSDGRSQQLILPMDLLGRIRRLPDACILKTMQPINESDLKALPMRGACAEVRVEHFLAEM
eukprot:422005-Pleurochrysis_carterae.AAC.1